MDIKSEDVMTDSDSGSSRGSWVFVDDIHPIDVNTPNQFYLNCLREPVQELTENDLGAVDCDSDSDGISVISETEESLKESSCDDSTQEFFTRACDEASEIVEDIRADDRVSEEITAQTNENAINLKKVFITSSLIGAGVVVVAILIAPYITPKANNDVSADRLGMGIAKKYSASPREQTAYFRCKRESKNKRLCFEKTHNESKFSGKPREFGNRNKNRYFENDYFLKKSAFESDNIKHVNTIERETEREKVLFVGPNKKSKKRNKEDTSCGDKIRNKEKKLKIKEEYLAKKEEYLIKKEYELLEKRIKLQKKLEKFKNSEEFNWKKTNKKYYKTGNYFNKINKSDGEWYTNFYKHREDARKKEHMADWLFDRASDRNKGRDEARWYFHWMFGRQEGRFRRPPRRQHA